MKKSDLATRVATRTSLSGQEADSAVNAMLAAIADALANGETVTLARFGAFSTKTRPARRGRNPRTGESVAIASLRTPSFNASETVRDALNLRPRKKHTLPVKCHSRTGRLTKRLTPCTPAAR